MKRYKFPDNGKYIYKTPCSTYQVVNTKLKQERKYFGTFKDYNDAIRHRDKCIANNWDESLVYQSPTKFITKKGNGWQIQKTINGKKEYFGRFRNLLDAMNERDLLVANDWDVEKVCELTDDTINGISLMKGRGV